MRKIVFALVITLGLGGCAQLQTALQVASLATKTIDNPVTTDDLYHVEQGVLIAFTALQTYKSSCAKGLVDVNCKTNVAAIQAYTRLIPPLLTQLRGFVKANDQINAGVIYNQITLLITNVRAEAAKRNVAIGG